MSDIKNNIIERYITVEPNSHSTNSLAAPSLKDMRIRIHIDKAVTEDHPSLADDAVIDLTKFAPGTEFNIRKLGDKGLAISARDPKNNSVFEFIYDHAASVKQLNVKTTSGQSIIFLNQCQEVNGPNGPGIMYYPDKLPLDGVKKDFKKLLEDNGFKFYEENPDIDKQKGHTIPADSQATFTSVSPVPYQQGAKGEVKLG